MIHYEDIRDVTSPLGIKNLNDTVRRLWDKVANIDTKDIKDGSVTSIKLIDKIITSEKIGEATIETAHIKDASITEAKIEDASITADKIVANTITANEIASNTITANEIATGSITASSGVIADIDASTIKTGKLTGIIIESENYVQGVSGSKYDLSDGSIDTKNFKVDFNGDVLMTDAIIEGEFEQYDKETNLPSVSIKNNAVQIYDWLNTGINVGSLTSLNNSVDGKKKVCLIAEKGFSVSISGKEDSSSTAYSIMEFSNDIIKSYRPINMGKYNIIDAQNIYAIDKIYSGGYQVIDFRNITHSMISLTTDWASFNYNITFFNLPTVVLTPNSSNSGAIAGKVRNVTKTGFEACIGETGTPLTNFSYIAFTQ